MDGREDPGKPVEGGEEGAGMKDMKGREGGRKGGRKGAVWL